MFANVKAWPRRSGAAGALLVGSIAVGGCFVEASDSAPPPVVSEPGRLTVRWTVDEIVDPNLCVMGRVAAIDITVSTAGGQAAGEYQAPCTAFATTISSLYAGNYVAEAILIDSQGRARTTAIDIRPFSVLERSELVIDVDFPADSFLDSLDRDALEGANDVGGDDSARPGALRAPPAARSESNDSARPSSPSQLLTLPKETR